MSRAFQRIFFLMCLAVSPTFLISCAVRSSGDVQNEISRVEEEYRIARLNGDVGFLERFYGKELRLIGANGAIIERDADIKMYAAREIAPESMENAEVKIMVYDDMAVVTGRETVTGRYKETTATVVVRFTDVLAFRNGSWQLIATQSTEIPEK